ncbi:MAG: T9SS type A sorting domain-containing protein [Bacteroidetes bacterium]|nr:T9SS type A sorting domain-containing protein [Bacteroidota bacterium]
MKRNLRSLTIITILIIFIFGTALFSETGLNANNSGAPSMRTGSPGDTKSCTTCHTGTAQHVTGIISSNIPPTGYVPGATYIIDALCTDSTRTRFGFEISPQNITGAKLGVLTVTDVARTKIIGSGKYITHTTAGTSGAGSILWSFNWTAPPAGSGDVTFYGAFNFSNHNNATSGDIIKLNELTVGEDLNLHTQEINAPEDFVIFPNPVNDFANINVPKNTTPEQINIFDALGKHILKFEWNQFSDGLKLNLSHLTEGTYYVSFATKNGTFSSKLIKQ